MTTYSFLNYAGAINGPGGQFTMGSGDGIAAEGVKTSMLTEKDKQAWGADGTLMHVLIAQNGGKVSVSVLKTSPLNSQLSQMYNQQKNNPVQWGTNVLTGADTVRGDNFTLSQAAFVKFPDNAWDEEGKVIDWEFIGILNEQLGAGVPDVNVGG